MNIQMHADQSVSINLEKIEAAQLWRALHVAVNNAANDLNSPDWREFATRLIASIELVPSLRTLEKSHGPTTRR